MKTVALYRGKWEGDKLSFLVSLYRRPMIYLKNKIVRYINIHLRQRSFLKTDISSLDIFWRMFFSQITQSLRYFILDMSSPRDISSDYFKLFPRVVVLPHYVFLRHFVPRYFTYDVFYLSSFVYFLLFLRYSCLVL